MFDISILCPTKNRADRLETMWQSAMLTAEEPKKIELVLYIENYDKGSILKSEELKLKYPGQISVFLSEKEEIYSNLHNICFEKAAAEIVMSAADDIIFRTKSWDKIVKKVFSMSKDKIMYVYPDDGHWGEVLGTHGFYHKNWFRVLGYMSPPIFTVDYSDNYVTELSKTINRSFYLNNVLVEHMHYTFGKSSMDQTAIEAHYRRMSTNNGAIYGSLPTVEKMKEDMNKLKTFMEKNND